MYSYIMKLGGNMFELSGFDDDAKVYFNQGQIIRIYNKKSSANAFKVFNTLKELGLKELSIVESDILIYEEGQRLVLEHQPILFMHPSNWTPKHLLKACELTIKLNLKLREHNLILKDMLPENILFENFEPIFIDFASIVREDSLPSLGWLMNFSRNKNPEIIIIKNMFYRFMLIPLLIGVIDSPIKMANLLRFNFCNSGARIPRISYLNFIKFGSKNKLKLFLITLKLLALMHLEKNPKKMETRISEYLTKLEVLMVSRKTPYVEYYKQKNVDFDFNCKNRWKGKQLSFEIIIDKYRPRTLLDIGSNTGWYSILSALKGVKVTAVDEDIASIEKLLSYSEKEFLPITCAVVSFQEIMDSTELSKGKFSGPVRFPENRFKHDMVIALGLIHHLSLGLGFSIGEIMEALTRISDKNLVIEFVELNDEKILSEKAFFPKYTEMLFGYSKFDLIKFGLRHFKTYEVLPSETHTRSLIVFTR
jgi:hypothetical protein